ncbi:hypothetical protein LCGC14_2498540 [marine sediment metagenome]|uniref:Uncharacterized protein n=1 Tax=marine sediment metagenome TaxID=412755 RepID=A0A0F9DWE7_9ZZZZ
MVNSNQYKEVETPIDRMYSCYQHYRGNSAGRVIHYITIICGLTIGEKVQVGNGKITYPTSNHLFAAYTWEKGYPDLVFNCDTKWNLKKDRLLQGEAHTTCYVIVDKTNDKVINPIEKGGKRGIQINQEAKAHDIAEHLAYTYPETLFEVLPVVDLVWSRKGF